MGRVRWFLGLGVLLVTGACARALVTDEPDGSTVNDAALGDSSACPQYNLKTDPQHCGSCTNACKTGEVCSNGACKASCEAPTVKCVADGGITCATTATDPQNCGQCGNACSTADAGSLPPGPNNPDAGIPYDGGSGWSVGKAGCSNSQCGVTCDNGFTKCSDNLCYDTQNFHDNCGACGTACTAQEWCNAGKCCTLGKLACNGTCVDVKSDPNNCGACGKVCSGGTPYCAAGVCTAGCSPSGTRQPFNTVQSKTATGCFSTSPCGIGNYLWSSANIQAFQAVNQEMVCGGTTACVGHVGIATWGGSNTVCHGTWDVYCDATKVGTISSSGLNCGADPMTNGCSTTFTPRMCSTIKFVLTAGTGVGCCLSSGSGPDTAISGVSAW